MAGKTRRKKPNKKKRIPYIEVEGVENRYLDAALLKSCDEGMLQVSLSDEFKLLKKAGISPQALKKKEHSQEELIELISPHMLESYDYYNFLANTWDEVMNKSLDYYIEEDYAAFTLEEWDTQIRTLIEEEELPIFAAINNLRFYKNGELKELIKPLIEEEAYAVSFYHETGVKIEGLEIDWDEVIEDELDELFDIEDEVEIDDELEEMLLLDEISLDRSPEETLKMAAKMILDVSERVSEFDQAEQYKNMYESEQEQVAKLKAMVSELEQELKSKDSQVQSLAKENRKLSKSEETLDRKLDHQQKEVGRLGGLLGEVRKEKEDLEKTNVILERRVNSLEKESDAITEKVKKELKKEFDKKAIKMQDEFEEKANQLESEVEELGRLLEEEQAKNSLLSTQVEQATVQLQTTKKDLEVVEKERNELMEQLNQSAVDSEDKQAEAPENDEDLLFGFDEDDIEDFVEFDNKPTRN